MNEISLADTINTALLLVTAFGVLAALWQIHVNTRYQRANFLRDLYMQLRSDPAIVEAFYEIEYSKFVYGMDFHGSDLEPKMDRLLTLVDLVCEMRAQRIITKREMGFFVYSFDRVAQNKSVQAYLAYLNNFAKNNHQKKPFAAFQVYARFLA